MMHIKYSNEAISHPLYISVYYASCLTLIVWTPHANQDLGQTHC